MKEPKFILHFLLFYTFTTLIVKSNIYTYTYIYSFTHIHTYYLFRPLHNIYTSNLSKLSFNILFYTYFFFYYHLSKKREEIRAKTMNAFELEKYYSQTMELIILIAIVLALFSFIYTITLILRELYLQSTNLYFETLSILILFLIFLLKLLYYSMLRFKEIYR